MAKTWQKLGKNLAKTWLIGVLIGSQVALAGLPPATFKGQSDTNASTTFNLQVPQNQATRLGGTTALLETGNKNLLLDPGFEGSSFASSWTASGGSFTADTTAANVGYGKQAGAWDPSAAAQTLTSTAVPVPPALYGQNGYARCSVKTTSTDVVMQAYDGTNVLNSVTISGNGSYQGFGINFQMPSSGNIQIRFLSASNSAVMDIDDCYLGAALNISAVSQIDDLTSYSLALTGSTSNPAFGTVATNSALHRRIGDSEEVRWDFRSTTAGTAGSGTYLISLPNGQTVDTTKVSASTSGFFGVVGQAAFFVNDGSSDYIGEGDVFVYDTTHLAIKIVDIKPSAGTGGAGVWGSGFFALSSFPTFSISLKATYPVLGRTANSTITPAVTSKSWQGRITGCTGSNTYASSSYGDFPAQTGCTSTDVVNDGFGTVTAAATGFGPTWTPQTNGTYLVCSTSTMSVSSVDMEARIVSSDGKVIDETAPTSPAGGSNFLVHSLCGLYSVSNAGSAVTFKWQAKSLSASTVTFRQDLITWKIVNVTNSLPNVILTGVPASSGASERIERAQVTVSSTAAAIVSQSGSWLSVANGASVGLTTGTMTGFSSAPSCSCTVIGAASTSASWCGFTAEPTSTNLSITRTRAGAAESGDVNIICMGAR